jgi:CheY-like chemotaxis protein
MSFVEAADGAPRPRTLQVFATDLNDSLLDTARHGLYAKSIAQDLLPERLRRFFVEEEGGYRVSKALREMIVFARQNVMSDPPFSRLDIISCRNLLIYFEPASQKKVFPIFHYALKPGGFLYLGASDSIGGFTDLFEPLDKKHRIYTKKAAATAAFYLPASTHRERPTSPDRIADRVRSTPTKERRKASAGSSGIGIAADQLERVFDMFTQVDTSLERSLNGLGIGLTLVRTLTEMHGGTVEVRSEGVGQGSEFVVRLPIAVETDSTASRPMAAQAVAATPLRILIVDDNRESADMLAILLQFAGHETFAAHDGLAAVEAAATLDPDVILLDIGLPVLNGYEAARRIREQQGQKRRPLLVALTGWGQDEDRRRSEEVGFDAHLVKPVDYAALGRLLAELSAGKQEVRH